MYSNSYELLLPIYTYMQGRPSGPKSTSATKDKQWKEKFMSIKIRQSLVNIGLKTYDLVTT